MKNRYNSEVSNFAGCMSITYLTVLLGGAVGWVMNIVKVIQMVDEPINGLFIARCVGVIAAPLGSVLGFIK